jgi:hypothetical protein
VGSLRESIRYPLRGEHAEEALLVGWICLLAHLLFVPLLALVPAIGYLVAVLRSTAAEGSTPPPVEYRRTLREGTVGSILVIGYALVPVAIGAITLELAGAAALDPEAGGSVLFFVGSTVTLFVLLGFLYALPIALCGYARGGIRGAVPNPAFGSVAGHGAYFVGWTSGFVVLAIGGLVGETLAALPVLGPVLAALWWWYVLLVGTRRIGLGYAAAR